MQMAQLLSSRQSASSSSQKALEAALAVAPAMQLPAGAAHRARDELKISTPQVRAPKYPLLALTSPEALVFFLILQGGCAV